MPVFNVTSSPLSTLTQAQQDNLILMSNTDIRTVLSNLASIATAQESQTASIALNTAGVTELKAVTVIEKTQVLSKTSFAFAANVWTINVFHELNNKFPITAIFDATGDVQFIQFVGKDLMNGTVELTQTQYDSNTFPLKIVLHGRASEVAPAPIFSTWKFFASNNTYYRLINSRVESSIDGINISATSTQEAAVAYMALAFNYIVTRTSGGDYVNFTSNLVQPYGSSTQGGFDEVRLAPGAFQL